MDQKIGPLYDPTLYPIIFKWNIYHLKLVLCHLRKKEKDHEVGN